MIHKRLGLPKANDYPSVILDVPQEKNNRMTA